MALAYNPHEMASKQDKVAKANPINDKIPQTVLGPVLFAHRTHPQAIAAGRTQ
jgi:hypothetical protein